MSEPTDVDAVRVSAAGRQRTMTVVRPAAVSPGAAAVLVFHGSNQDGATVRRFAGHSFDLFAQRGGVVVAYLDGYRRSWNDARISSTFAARRDGVDDVAFTDAAIDHVQSRYAIDVSRVFVVGFSAGGAMVIRLIHQIPARLAGAAIICATQPVPDNFMRFEAPATPLPTLLFHGTRDRLVPYGGGMASLWGFRPRGVGLSAPQSAAYYAARNGISAPPISRHLASGSGGDRTTIERTDYRQDGHPPVTLYTVHGGGHTIPGPHPAPRIMGRTTRRLIAADAIGDFFGLARPLPRTGERPRSHPGGNLRGSSWPTNWT